MMVFKRTALVILQPMYALFFFSARMYICVYNWVSALSVYEVYDESAAALDTSSVRLGKSLVNAFMIVLVLAGTGSARGLRGFLVMVVGFVSCVYCRYKSTCRSAA